MQCPRLVFLSYLFAIMDDVNAQSFLPQNFTRWFWQNSIIADNWLYIDGGEVWNNAAIGSPTAVLNLTLAIDLSISWSNATVSPKFTEKPLGFPLARHMPLWHDNLHNLIYAFGGWPYAGRPLTWPNNLTNDIGYPRQTVWHFQTDGHGLYMQYRLRPPSRPHRKQYYSLHETRDTA